MEFKKVKLNDFVTMQVMAYSDELMTAKFWFTGPGFASTHHHGHEEVNVVISGEFEATCGDEKSKAYVGDVVNIGPDIEHDMKCLSTEGVMISTWTPARKDLLKIAGL